MKVEQMIPKLMETIPVSKRYLTISLFLDNCLWIFVCILWMMIFSPAALPSSPAVGVCEEEDMRSML